MPRIVEFSIFQANTEIAERPQKYCFGAMIPLANLLRGQKRWLKMWVNVRSVITIHYRQQEMH
jgi:hypothetical protein